MSTSAQSRRCRPKKKYDQSAFGTRCKNQTTIATSLFPRRQTRQAAIALARYSSVQTGPNSQDGGFQAGLIKLAYHGPGANEAPNAAVRNTATKKIAKTAKLRLFTRNPHPVAQTPRYFARFASAASISANRPGSFGLILLG